MPERRARPATRRAAKPKRAVVAIPESGDAIVEVEGKELKLTNLGKPFWPELGVTKGDLIRYYASVSPWLLPHIADRAMVMKRYPNGAYGDFFFMKRAPAPRPPWIRLCPIDHGSSGVIDFPVIDGLPALLWVVNLGCIDLNPWYAHCDDTDRPDVLHFDLDPFEGATFAQVLEAALVVKDALGSLGMPAYAKTTGSRGVHVYVPIVRGPTQKHVWQFSKALGDLLAARHPKLLTAVYSTRTRPKGRVLVDYNQNQWGRTLSSIYSVRPRSRAPVSTPVTWDEVEKGLAIEDFRIDNVVDRLEKLGDLWAPLLAPKGRYDLRAFVGGG